MEGMMPDSTKLVKAEIHELNADLNKEINSDKWVTVQFNPETLKVSFSNQINPPGGAGAQNGTQNLQFTGGGTTKLSVQIWFDLTSPAQADNGAKQVKDVRKLTEKVAYFITPEPRGKGTPPAVIPPVVRFIWGSFQFDGLMDSLEESLEFFSNEGVPLRASMTFSLTQQKIQKFAFRGGPPSGAGLGPGAGVPGTQTLAQAPAGSTLQSIADSQGKGADWKAIASANDIENPRSLRPGQLVNLNVNISGSQR
jgi:hypothetical protein